MQILQVSRSSGHGMNSASPTLRWLLRNRRVVATLIVGSAFLALVCRTGLVRLHLVLLAAVEVAVAAEHGIALLVALHAEGLQPSGIVFGLAESPSPQLCHPCRPWPDSAEHARIP